MAHVVHVFHPFQVDVAARELRRDGQAVPLPASVFDCLTYLIEHRERAVGRDELIAAVWGRTDVSDTVLGQTVLKVRRAVGDTGSEQHSIRTVPRFGYRWVADIESLFDSPAPTSQPADTAIATPTRMIQSVPAATRWWPLAIGALLTLVLIGALGYSLSRLDRAPQASRSSTGLDASQGALVLPTRVQAPTDWNWLRLGLMDLVAEQLRAARISTVASESVVALTGTDDDPLPRLAESGLTGMAHWRIQPEATWNQGTWRVALEARSDQQELMVDAEGEDVVQVARAASDALLLRLGRRPGADDNAPHGLHELLQRTRAAMLDDQFDLARTLIANAPSGLRERGELVHRLSQIELRAGNYPLVQQLLEDLLPSLEPETQPVLRGRSLTTLAASHVRRYQADAAERAYDEAVQLLHDRGEPAALGLALHGQGLIDMLHGRLDEAVARLGNARLEMQAAGDALGIAQVDLNLGLIDQLRDRPADALVKLRASAERFQVLGGREERLYSLARITETHNRLLDHDLA